MADIELIINPLVSTLRNITVNGQRARGVYMWDVDYSDTVQERSWYVDVGEREPIENDSIGRYRESITFRCTFALDSVTENRASRRSEAAQWQQAAIETFRTREGMILGSGNLVTRVSPVITAGGLDLSNDTWVSSEVEITVTRWVLY